MAEAFNYLAILRTLHIIFAIFALVPLAFNVRYYLKFKNRDYLFLSIYFFVGSFYNLFEMAYFGMGLNEQISDLLRFLLGNILLNTVNILDVFPLLFVAARAKYDKIPNYIKGFFGIGIVMTIIAWIDGHETYILGNINFVNFFLMINRFTGHFLVAYFFLTTAFIKSKNTIRSRNLWVIASVGWVISMLIATAGIFDSSVWDNPAFNVIFFIPLLIGIAALVINHTFYPEAVLITYEQIVRAKKMYNFIDKKEKDQSTPQLGIDRIREYLQSVNEEQLVELSN